MLQDYRNYIINIRNGLIQCGVDVSISPLASYKELFYEADRISQILWFYSVMGISGSSLALDGFFIDLNGYYKDKMRQRFLSEFQDYYDSYKHISKLAYLAGTDEVGGTVEDEDEFDLFGDSANEAEVGGVVLGSDVVETIGTGNSNEFDGEEVHGTFIDEENIYYNIDKVLGTGYIPAKISVDLMVQGNGSSEAHGVFIDELAVEVAEEEDIHGIFLDEVENGYVSNDEDIHGTILDDIGSEGSTEYSEDDTYDDIHYSDDEEYISSEEDEVYDDIHYSDDEDEEYNSDEEEEVYDDIHYSDDEEDEYYPDYEEEPYDDIHYADDDEDYVEPRVFTNANNPSTNVVTTQVVKEDEDMSDIIQNGVNAILTKGKRFILTETRKLREVEKK